MSKLYPRKQTFFIFLICIIAVVAVAFYVYDATPKNDSGNNKNLLVNNGERLTNPIITESDWQKSFFENSTSSKSFKATAKSLKTSEPEAPLTATDILGRNFFTKYMELRKTGLTNDTQAVASAANQVITESVAGITPPKIYSLSNIKIMSSSDITVIKSYAETFMNILKSYMPEKNEAEIAMNAFEKNDMTMLKKIDPIISGYESALKNLLATPVPQPLAEYHLALLNGISMQIFNAKSLRKTDIDPVTALAAVGLEVKSLEMVSGAIGGMQNYFTIAGIIFVPPVSGSILGQ